jgi:hypothetical protein
MSDVGDLYRQRLAERQADADAIRARERTTSMLRLASVAATIAIAFWSWVAALVPAIAFAALVVFHERLVRRRRVAEAGAAFYERGLARLEDRWAGLGDPGTDLREEHHPYADDLDLFGRGSLFELVSLAVTHAGRLRLGSWLEEPCGDASEIRSRQAAVFELRENLALREDLSIAAQTNAREMESGKLDAWAALPPVTITPLERMAMFVLPVATWFLIFVSLPALIARLVGWTHPEAELKLGVLAGIPAWPMAIAIVVTVMMARRLAPRVEGIVSAVERAEPALALLGNVVQRIERESFTAPRLAALHATLRGKEGEASREIERLRRLVALLEARRNQFFAPFALLLLWTPHLAMAIERWRTQSGAHITEWIEAVGEIEALSSLASFALEHPSFTVPEIVERGPLFDAVSLGHPLIPAARRIANDIRLDDELRLLVISGSNMSGKSTMMRSVGIAAVLAMAGAPVCAKSLRIAPTAVGACISIHDSLQENASRFYAEILRIRQVIELSRRGALLFLLDEILAGTNSQDRRIGAEAIVRGLVERGAIGTISTHDLALAEIAQALAPRAANVHFEDRIDEGRVVFDYRMRPGVVTRSNALALMRSVGIEV